MLLKSYKVYIIFFSTLDEKMSDKYLSKSCELGSVVGCYNYANFKKMSDETVSI